MYKNIGAKIKGLAKFIYLLGSITSIAYGIFVIGSAVSFDVSFGIAGKALFIGIIIIVLGAVLSWLGSLCIYGFGELIERVTEIAESTRYSETEGGSI